MLGLDACGNGGAGGSEVGVGVERECVGWDRDGFVLRRIGYR